MDDSRPNRDLVDRTTALYLAAIDRESATVADYIGEIGTHYGHSGVYALCCGLAEIVLKIVFPDQARGDGTLTSDMFVLAVHGDLTTDRVSAARLWAARFVTMYGNGDAEGTLALFFGGLDDEEQAVGNVRALIGIAADLGRAKFQQTTGETP